MSSEPAASSTTRLPPFQRGVPRLSDSATPNRGSTWWCRAASESQPALCRAGPAGLPELQSSGPRVLRASTRTLPNSLAARPTRNGTDHPNPSSALTARPVIASIATAWWRVPFPTYRWKWVSRFGSIRPLRWKWVSRFGSRFGSRGGCPNPAPNPAPIRPRLIRLSRAERRPCTE